MVGAGRGGRVGREEKAAGAEGKGATGPGASGHGGAATVRKRRDGRFGSRTRRDDCSAVGGCEQLVAEVARTEAAA